MKRKLLVLSGLLLLAAMLLAVPTLVKKSIKPPAAVSSVEDASPETGYILRAYKSGIGVFEGNESEPVSVLNVDINTLPDTDKSALILGIYVADEDELNRRIEDYSS